MFVEAAEYVNDESLGFDLNSIGHGDAASVFKGVVVEGGHVFALDVETVVAQHQIMIS